jgi:spermidine/putrescine transport system permease protein
VNASVALPVHHARQLRDEVSALRWLVTPLALWLLVFLVIPLAFILIYSFTRDAGMTLGRGGWGLDQYERMVQVAIYRKVFLRSLAIGLWAAILTLLIGYLPAYYMSRATPRARNILLLLLIMPFWTPYIIRIFAWMLILSTNGVLNKLLLTLGLVGQPLDLLYTRGAVMVGLVYSGLPFMILPIYATMSRIDKGLYEAAMNLGATEMHGFLEITVPLSLPGVWAGSIMAFILAAGSFLAPAILGGPEQIMISQVIASRFMQLLDWPLGAALAGLYMLLTVAIVIAANRVVTLQAAFRMR